ncbi:MAG: YqeG family HAD IIIA-type phosphatase [Fimbriimonadales bacterium]
MIRYERSEVQSAFRRFCPSFRARKLSEIVPSELVASGIKAVLLDVDNTLVNWKAMHIPEETSAWIQDCMNAGLKLCLVSNTRNPARLHELSNRLGIPYARGKMKPSRQPFEDALRKVNATVAEAVMVGDQMFTDVWGGNRMGMITIWLEPRHSREFFGTKISRVAEKAVGRLIERAKKH